MQNPISLKAFQIFVHSILNHLEKKEIHQIRSFNFTPVSSTHGTAKVNVILKNKMNKTIDLNLEKREANKINITELALTEELPKNGSCTLGPLDYQDPKKQSQGFTPAVPILPSFWGGGI